MKEIINISTGEVGKGNIDNILISNGIGSCIVIAAFNIKKRIGAMAHVMLPGKAPITENQNKTKYAEDAIEKLLQFMAINMDEFSNIEVCLIGAGNVLKKTDDTICKNNVLSIIALLKKLKIKVSATSLGGYLRRTVRFNIETGEIFYTEGDSKLTLLKRWN